MIKFGALIISDQPFRDAYFSVLYYYRQFSRRIIEKCRIQVKDRGKVKGDGFMKKSILVWLSVVFLFVITACGSGARTHENTDSVQEATTEEVAKTGYIEQPGVTFYLPEGWQLETVDENGVYSYTSSDINCVLRAEYIETDSQIDLIVTDSVVR